MQIFKQIVEWNKARNNLEFDAINESAMLEEEWREFHEADFIDEQVDALADIIVVAAGGLFKLGYDPEKVMQEVVNHISSRKQNQIQKKQWEESGADGKWLKDKEQLVHTIYQPNFDSCKI